jgi:nucleotide-binding universal stress UspA family protein
MIATATVGAPWVRVERTVVAGGAAASLLDVANAGDVVVVGGRGLGGVRRLRLGAVSNHVVRHAPGTVVVVPIYDTPMAQGRDR